MNRFLCAALALACVAFTLGISVLFMPPQWQRTIYGTADLINFVSAVVFLCWAAWHSVTIRNMRMRDRCVALIGAVLVLALSPWPASAAEVRAVGDTAVIVPWGQWVTAIAQTATEVLVPIVIAAVGIAARKLPWFIGMWFTTQRIDRMVRLAADYALNAVAGATADKAITVDVGYTVLKVALERALGSSPAWLIEAAGGTKGITERLFRAFRFDESVTDANTLTPLLRDLGAETR